MMEHLHVSHVMLNVHHALIKCPIVQHVMQPTNECFRIIHVPVRMDTMKTAKYYVKPAIPPAKLANLVPLNVVLALLTRHY